MSNKNASQYDSQENLQDILERLALYCLESGVKNPSITVILPKAAQERFSQVLVPKEKLQPSQPAQATVTKLYTAGVVEIHNSDEFEAVRKKT